jgi:hypothetical protein
MQIPMIITDRSVVVFIHENTHTLENTHPNFQAVVDELKKPEHDLDKIVSLISVKNYIEGQSFGRVTVSEDKVYYNNEPVDNYLTRKMLQLFRDGFDITTWATFADNLMQNPVDSARAELYEFLEISELPLTDDGCFLAYKKVRDDYRSYYAPNDERFDHSIGNWVEEEDSKVDRNRDRTCSSGLHFCSKEYLPKYYGSEGRIVIVKINPADVRAIPTDYNRSKGRAVKYKIVGELNREESVDIFNKSAVYGFRDNESYRVTVTTMFDEDYDEYDDEYDDYSDDDYIY